MRWSAVAVVAAVLDPSQYHLQIGEGPGVREEERGNERMKRQSCGSRARRGGGSVSTPG